MLTALMLRRKRKFKTLVILFVVSASFLAAGILILAK
jgi:hypothetical protein